MALPSRFITKEDTSTAHEKVMLHAAFDTTRKINFGINVLVKETLNRQKDSFPPRFFKCRIMRIDGKFFLVGAKKRSLVEAYANGECADVHDHFGHEYGSHRHWEFCK